MQIVDYFYVADINYVIVDIGGNKRMAVQSSLKIRPCEVIDHCQAYLYLFARWIRFLKEVNCHFFSS